MAFLGKGKKEDLVELATELGLEVSSANKVYEIKKLITTSENYMEDDAMVSLDRIIEERIRREEKEERIRREEKEERIRREKEEQIRQDERRKKERIRELEMKRLEVRSAQLKKLMVDNQLKYKRNEKSCDIPKLSCSLNESIEQNKEELPVVKHTIPLYEIKVNPEGRLYVEIRGKSPSSPYSTKDVDESVEIHPPDEDTCGFIEAEDQKKEICYHQGVLDDNVPTLKVEQNFEYVVTNQDNQLRPEGVRELSSGPILKDDEQPDILNGVVPHSLQNFNSGQEQEKSEHKDTGKVRIAAAENMERNSPEYELGVTSLEDKPKFLQKDYVAQFHIDLSKKGEEQEVNVKDVQTRIEPTADTNKGNFAIISDDEEDKKFCVHESEVQGDDIVTPLDDVELKVVQHQRQREYSTHSAVQISDSQPMLKTGRLNRLHATSFEGGGASRVLIRHPKDPDGSSGFKMLCKLKKNDLDDVIQNLPLNQVLFNEICLHNYKSRKKEAVQPNIIAYSHG